MNAPHQLPLPLNGNRPANYHRQFQELLAQNLDFHGQNSSYASHDVHAFPAKFPPQLPKLFIEQLTKPNEIVLDPMMGSGTTIVEALLLGRTAIGFDIDPMALMLGKVKTNLLDLNEVAQVSQQILQQATQVSQDNDYLAQQKKKRFGEKEEVFIDYWFAADVQMDLLALIEEIGQVENRTIRQFFELAFSSIIITKSGGVSRARDLAHTRPHRVEDKKPRSVFYEFSKRVKKNIKSLALLPAGRNNVHICQGNAQQIALPDNCVDLIVTSPPYASNAIDYMRAHKFSLIWLGYPMANLSALRRDYIGHTAITQFEFKSLPETVSPIVEQLQSVDSKKGKSLHRYYSEMVGILGEMGRVLRPGKAAIVVVGSSTLRGMDTQTGYCLGEIGKMVGLELVDVAVRRLDRDKRMMPARRQQSPASVIEERMHEEYVIGFLKSE